MVKIPKNNADKLIAKQKAAHQKELDIIAKQFLDKLKHDDYAKIICSEHMIGSDGSNDFHHLSDTIEAAKQFKAQGYYCYYYDFYNRGGVNMKAVLVRKTPLLESLRQSGNRIWYEI